MPSTTPPDAPLSPPLYSQRERRALAVFAVAAVAAILWIARPVAIGLFLGVLTSFTMEPLYKRLRTRVRGKFDWAALACVLIAAIGLAGLLGTFGTLLIERGAAVARSVPQALTRGGVVTMATGSAARLFDRFHLPTAEITQRLGEAVGSVASRATAMAGVLASATFDGLLAFFFVLLTLHFTLRNWDSLARRVETMLPLHPRHTRALMDEFRRVGRTVLAGTVITGLAQGFLAGVGYAITGVPDAALLGAITAIASLVPAIGTLVVWVPAGAYLLLTGHAGRGIAELVWGSVVVVGISDYVIRPRMVRGEGEMPSLVTFVALFGGIEVFGIVGLVLGPVIMALAFSVLRIYERERSAQHVLRVEG